MIPREAWSFVQPAGGGTPAEIRLDGGFKPGRIYQLTYTARDPIVVALGMAGIRDLLSYLRNNPLEGTPPPQKTAIFGISQSGRLIQTMLLRGLHVDEDGRPVFDGAFIHVAGGGKGGFDYRFAMPTRHFSVLEDHIYPTDYFPFTTTTARDPVTGAEASVLDRARALGAVPKLFYVNNSSEYWNRAASLIATDPEGKRDLPPAPEARIYHIAGAQHYAGVQRAARHLRELREHAQPLPRDARLDGGVRTLGARRYRAAAQHLSAHRRRHAGDGRGLQGGVSPHPECPAAGEQSAAAAPRFRSALRQRTDRRHRAAGHGPPFEALVPKPDADGLDLGGIRLPEMLVPLGTRTGFNTRTEAAGFPWATGRWDGSFVPFARTEAERQAAGDPRPSLAARYADRGAYEAKVRAAAADVVGKGFLLPDGR